MRYSKGNTVKLKVDKTHGTQSIPKGSSGKVDRVNSIMETYIVDFTSPSVMGVIVMDNDLE